MLTSDTPIDYRYLNMDTNQFVPNYQELIKQVGPGAILRAASNELGQVLYAAGQTAFSQSSMVLTCRRLTFGTTTRT
jgi:hypothetical protein